MFEKDVQVQLDLASSKLCGTHVNGYLRINWGGVVQKGGSMAQMGLLLMTRNRLQIMSSCCQVCVSLWTIGGPLHTWNINPLESKWISLCITVCHTSFSCPSDRKILKTTCKDHVVFIVNWHLAPDLVHTCAEHNETHSHTHTRMLTCSNSAWRSTSTFFFQEKAQEHHKFRLINQKQNGNPFYCHCISVQQIWQQVYFCQIN